MSESLFEVRSLSHQFGTRRVLEELDLSIQPGEVISILGPNGAGKTTLIRILCRLQGGWHGEILYRRQKLQKWPRRVFARQIAYVPQQVEVSFSFTARDVVLMGRLPHQEGQFFETAEDDLIVREMLELTGAAPFADRYFHDLSGGERQLVVLASALAQEPQVLVLDEPTSFLDLKHQLQIYRILKRQHEEEGKTLILVTHDLNLAQSFSSRIILLKAGKKVAEVGPFGDFPVLTPELVGEVFDLAPQDTLLQDRQRLYLSFEA